MDAFEFVFTLFGLVLGLALTEVLGGFSRAIKAARPAAGSGKTPVRIGWLTPLLGLFVMIDIVSFWTNTWAARDLIPPEGGALVLGLLVFGVYYLAASLVFPEDPADWPDFDIYYLAHKRQVVAGMVFCNVVPFTVMTIANGGPPRGNDAYFFFGLFLVLLLGIALLKNKRASLAALIVSLLLAAGFPIMSLFVGG